MKKVLIVADNEALRQSVGKVLELVEHTCISASHEDALAMFLAEEPDAVVILDYSERMYNSKGHGTYRDIKGSATEKQKIIRSGFEPYTYPDYLKLPFLLPALYALIE